MSNKVIIAAAGSGKTQYLVKEALKSSSGNVLITTFTDKNTEEIKSRIIARAHSIPTNITVMPWFSFLLKHGVRPYQSMLYADKRIDNLILMNQQSAPMTKESDFCHHYLNNDGKIYSDKISKLVCKIDKQTNRLVISRLSKIYSSIFIDEVQDLAGYDLEFIKLLLHSPINILLVGDHRQGTFTTNNSSKNKQYRQERINTYFSALYTAGIIEYDDTTLQTNYRCVPEICNFANSIFPEYSQCVSGNKTKVNHMGVYIVKDDDVDSYLDTFSPVQLRNNKTTAVSSKYPVINFGASKGQSFDRVLIYPTHSIIDWILKGAELKPETRSKLYVAVTRARYSVAFVYTPNETDVLNIPLYKKE